MHRKVILSVQGERGERRSVFSLLFVLLLIAGLGACRPALPPLRGVEPTNGVLPEYHMRPGSRRVVFNWEMTDDGMVLRGEGLVRLAYPDSARVDLVVHGAFGGGASVILLNDDVYFPLGASMTHLLPSPTLLWAAVGRLHVNVPNDTVIRVRADTLRADLGKPVEWRVTGVGDKLVRLDRVKGRRVAELVEWKSDSVVYYQMPGRRELTMKMVSDSTVAGFNESVWQF